MQKFRDEWATKVPKQKVMFVLNSARFVFDLVGVRVLSDLRVYWLSYIPAVMVLDLVLSTFYTIQYYYRDDRLLIGMQSTCLYGVTIPVRISNYFYIM